MYYQKHLFICTNAVDKGKPFCQSYDSEAIRQYLKSRLEELDAHGSGKIRVSSSGCLGQCTHGPVMVIYPEQTWYTWVDKQDIDEIIEQDLIKGNIVKRLLITPQETT